MKTGIGQSKYCISRLFSRCLISLCSSLFDFNSIEWVSNIKLNTDCICPELQASECDISHLLTRKGGSTDGEICFLDFPRTRELHYQNQCKVERVKKITMGKSAYKIRNSSINEIKYQ